mmetsp:Transcript_13292/g.45078  ORF Transcript_13292/g.45078 Transcript_13292/m.45078 type:complete len:430 (-) Transcript_13292:223-1512(-)
MGRGGDGGANATSRSDVAATIPRQERKEEQLAVVLYGKRVDVTKFSRTHPGGQKVFRIFNERDATEQFEAYHSKRAIKMMEGMLKKSEPAPADVPLPSQSEIGKDFRAMIDKHIAQGYYEPCPLDELFKLTIVLGPIIIGACMLKGISFFGVTSPLLATLAIAFGFYLDGWLAHDYLHHSVFKGSVQKTVGWNNFVGYFLGFVQGYDVAWWRARHNTHHVCTNEHGSDPDIKTAPVLVFVRNDPRIAKALNAFQRYQQYYYVPLMAILDVYWRVESLMYIFARLPKTAMPLALMVAHHALLLWVYWAHLPYLLVLSYLRGFMTGIVVFATHYGEDILEADEVRGMTLAEQTAKTSRNITGGWLMNVLTGFISLQTEHHLFPMMPTGNLMKVQPDVRAFFKKHGLEYRESNLIECVKYNIKALAFEHLLY